MPDRLLTGWGRTAPSRARLVELAAGDGGAVRPGGSAQDVATLLAEAGPRGLIPRGLGRSYNDAAQNGGGTVLRLPSGGSADGWRLDARTGLVTCGAGVRLSDLIDGLLPLGWFPPVTPGTSQVTVGGMLAADVHGKNHHRDGSIGAHVHDLELVAPGAGVVRLGPTGPRADWYWATIGGMGLTGVITEATIQLLPIAGPRIRSVETRQPDLDALMDGLLAADTHHYSVAWVDGTARGRRFGRGLISAGEHAPAESRAEDQARGRGRGRGPLLRVPVVLPATPLNRWTIAAFNEAWFHKPGAGERVTSVRSFFHPLDAVGDWNRIYGPRGFVQYQFVVPDAGAGLVRQALHTLQSIGAASFMSVLKRFGAGNPAPLSFPSAGWTLALDLPAGVPGLARALDELDEQVAAAGGRVYLAKDGRVRPEVLTAMYPRLDEWRAVREVMDPHRVMRSDLGRRLGL